GDPLRSARIRLLLPGTIRVGRGLHLSAGACPPSHLAPRGTSAQASGRYLDSPSPAHPRFGLRAGGKESGWFVPLLSAPRQLAAAKAFVAGRSAPILPGQ